MVVQSPWLGRDEELPEQFVQVLNAETYNDAWALKKLKENIANFFQGRESLKSRFYLVSYQYCSPHGEETYWKIIRWETKGDEKYSNSEASEDDD